MEKQEPSFPKNRSPQSVFVGYQLYLILKHYPTNHEVPLFAFGPDVQIDYVENQLVNDDYPKMYHRHYFIESMEELNDRRNFYIINKGESVNTRISWYHDLEWVEREEVQGYSVEGEVITRDREYFEEEEVITRDREYFEEEMITRDPEYFEEEVEPSSFPMYDNNVWS